MSNLVTPESSEKDRAAEMVEWNNRLNQYVDELNKLAVSKEGSWANSQEFGLVWVPAPGDNMGGKHKAPGSPPDVIKSLVEFAKNIDFNNTSERSVVVVKIGTKDPQASYALQMNVIRQILEPRRELLQEKKLTVMFMSSEDDISTISEEDMNKAGWVKKDKPLIITPDKF
jgi:hypothetical protein